MSAARSAVPLRESASAGISLAIYTRRSRKPSGVSRCTDQRLEKVANNVIRSSALDPSANARFRLFFQSVAARLGADGLMVYSFARIGAAIGMRVEDVYPQNRRLWVRLHEKGGKQHAMPCHHNLEAYLHEYIDGAGLANEPKALLFQTYSRATGQLTGNPLPQANAYAMIQRRAKSAGITTRVGNHTFRATGVTAYLKNGGTLERAAQMANHASTRTTQLYDRRAEEVTLDEVERILV